MELLGIDVLLRVDGHVRSLLDVEALFQRDPHPGGHRYFLGFEGPQAERLLLGVSQTRSAPPTEDEARRVLGSLQMFLQRVPRDNVVMLLNSIDTLVVEKGRIHISGICSPLVGHDAPPNPPLQRT